MSGEGGKWSQYAVPSTGPEFVRRSQQPILGEIQPGQQKRQRKSLKNSSFPLAYSTDRCGVCMWKRFDRLEIKFIERLAPHRSGAQVDKKPTEIPFWVETEKKETREVHRTGVRYLVVECRRLPAVPLAATTDRRRLFTCALKREKTEWTF